MGRIVKEKTMTTKINLLSAKYFNTPENTIDVDKYLRQDGTLAVNVKWYFPHLSSELYKLIDEGCEEEDAINEIVQRVFWWKANQIAISYGYATCYPMGRSNGWAQPMLPNKDLDNSSSKVKPLKFDSDCLEIEYLAKLKTFLLFAEDIESLFTLIDKEIQYVNSPDDLNELANQIYDL